MKKITLALSITVISLGFISHANSQNEQPIVQHYEAQNIETTEEALDVLDKEIAKIADTLETMERINKDPEYGSKIEFHGIEAIHVSSYSLEAAIDRLRADKAVTDNKLDALDETVQAIHFASEKKEEAKTREWFIKLTKAFDDIDSNETVKIEKKEFYEIVIKDHKFSPEELIVPAGQKIKLIIDNQDPTPEEFESYDLNREKIISGNKKATIFIGPLKAGKYHYFGEFNMDSANGYIIAQ